MTKTTTQVQTEINTNAPLDKVLHRYNSSTPPYLNNLCEHLMQTFIVYIMKVTLQFWFENKTKTKHVSASKFCHKGNSISENN